MDYCVKQSAIGFKKACENVKVRVILTLTRAVDANNNAQQVEELRNAGVEVVEE